MDLCRSTSDLMDSDIPRVTAHQITKNLLLDFMRLIGRDCIYWCPATKLWNKLFITKYVKIPSMNTSYLYGYHDRKYLHYQELKKVRLFAEIVHPPHQKWPTIYRIYPPGLKGHETMNREYRPNSKNKVIAHGHLLFQVKQIDATYLF